MKLKGSVWAVFFALMAIAVLSVTLVDAQVGRAAEVVIALTDDPPSGDPHKARGSNGGHLLFNVYDGLVALSGDMTQITPALATRWENLDERTWRFHLRRGVRFHNGEEFNAEVVRHSIERLLDPNAVRFNTEYQHIEGVTIVDSFTVDIRTRDPDPVFIARMAGLHMVPPRYTESVSEEELGRRPVGTGPYRFVSWERGQRLVLEAFDGYWGGRPAVSRLVYKPVPEASTRLAELLSGTSDIIANLSFDDIARIERDPSFRVEANTGRRTAFVNMDLLPGGPPMLRDRRVRLAMNHAIDRQLLVDALLDGYGTPLATIYRPDFFGYDPSLRPYEYDPARARALLAEAGYPNGFEVGLHTSDGIVNKGIEVAEAIASMLGDVGIRVNVVVISQQALRETIIFGQQARRNQALWIWNWGSPLPDANSPLSGLLVTGAISSFFADPSMDELIAAARSEMNPERRTALHHQIQRRLYEDPPMIPLYLQLDVYGVNNRLEWTARKDEFILGVDIRIIR